MIAYFANDLLWMSKLRGGAEAAGVEAAPARTPERLRERLEAGASGLAVDLDAPDRAIELITTAREWIESRGGASSVRILAFGPHVDTASMERAREAGAGRVIARGALDRALEANLAWLDGAGADD